MYIFFITSNILTIIGLLYGIYTQKLPFITVGEIKPFLDQIDAKHEKRVRRFWLISFLLSIVFIIISTLIEFMNLELGTEATIQSIFYQLITVLAQMLGFWIFYHCAYKKKGTALLMLSISTRTFVLVMSIFEIWEHAALLDPLGWLFIALPFSIDALFWVSCIKLYKINSKIEYQTVLALKHKYGADANGFCL